MDIRQIRYFLRVAELRSFTRAAVDLGVAQPALSRQVKLLEEEFGVILLHRHGRGVSPTAAGAELLERSAGLIAEFDQLGRDMQVKARPSQPGGSMTLGVPISLSHVVTMPIVTRCREGLPDVAVRVVEGHSEMIADWLISGRVELAILFGDQPRRTIVAQALAYEEIAAVAVAGSPWSERSSFTAEDLERVPLILPRRPHATCTMLDRAGIHPMRIVEADTLVEIMQHVLEHKGVALLSAAGAAHELAAGRVRAVPVRRPGLRRVLVLGHAASRPLPAAAKAVAPLIRAGIADLALHGSWGVRILGRPEAVG